MSIYILVVDDEPDVEALFRQQFRRDLWSGRFADSPDMRHVSVRSETEVLPGVLPDDLEMSL
jgi:hypothetical protein